MFIIDNWRKRHQFDEGFEKGSAHAEVGRLIFSQLRFIHNKENSVYGIEYIDAALELTTHHLSEAEKNLSKSMLTYAVDSHMNKYKEQMRGLTVTFSDQEKTMLANSHGLNLRVYRHRDLSCKFALGTPGDVVVDEIIRLIFSRLPEKMIGGPISE